MLFFVVNFLEEAATIEEFIKVNGVKIHDPASVSYQLIDLSSEESGRIRETGYEVKDCIAQKRKLICRWNAMPVKEASFLCKCMKKKGVYLTVTFFDIAECGYVTATFTTGDFQCEYLAGWTKTRKLVGNITCNFIEA